MVSGEVTSDGEVLVQIEVAGSLWPAVIDTSFNGFLELPEALFESLNPVFNGQVPFKLAAGQEIVEDIFIVDFPFDDKVIIADANFVDGDTILIGTALLRGYRLEVDFVARTVKLDRVASP